MRSMALAESAAYIIATAVVGIPTALLAGNYLQLQAVEGGRPLLHTAGRWVGYTLAFVVPMGAAFVAEWVVGWDVTTLHHIVAQVVVFLAIAPGYALDRDAYRKARIIYFEYQDADEDWTEAHARGETWEVEL